ncbi:MAG: ribonuclease P protein component [Ilumatobacteraceae bacterium]
MIGRVHGRQAFVRFRTEGRRFRAGDLWCVAIFDDSLDGPHVAYAIGKPVGPAVVRNLVRRRLRAAAAAHHERWPAGWYLIGVRPAAARRSYQELDAMLVQVLQQFQTVTS